MVHNEIIEDFYNLAKEKNIKLYWRFSGRKATKWMGNHVHNCVTAAYIQTIRLESAIYIEIPQLLKEATI